MDQFYKSPSGTFVNTKYADPSLAGGRLYSSAEAGISAPAPVNNNNGGSNNGSSTNNGGSLVDRYSQGDATINNNPAFNVPAPDENAIRSKYRGLAEANVGAIRATFDKYLTEDTAAKASLTSKAYITSLASGLSGSPQGATNETNAADQGQRQIEKDTAQRDALVASAYADADTRASTEFQNARNDYLKSAGDKYTAEQNLTTSVKNTAMTELQNIASARSYEQFTKEAGQSKVAQYMKETGLDETGLKAYFLNANKPTLVSDTPKIIGNKAVWFQKHSDGTIGQVSIDLPAAPKAGVTIKDTRLSDGGVQVLYSDGTYKTIGNNGAPFSSTSDFGSLSPADQKTGLNYLLTQNASEADKEKFKTDRGFQAWVLEQASQ